MMHFGNGDKPDSVFVGVVLVTDVALYLLSCIELYLTQPALGSMSVNMSSGVPAVLKFLKLQSRPEISVI